MLKAHRKLYVLQSEHLKKLEASERTFSTEQPSVKKPVEALKKEVMLKTLKHVDHKNIV